ncbi:hypothetical protein ACG04Q_11925 [Roseateles sp. DXS20W]|uniref:Uncharacterized protein n=1 Tax=Pelomonas lactea TaxID=3299030 RepID=A0ABW7GKA5_9BURK
MMVHTNLPAEHPVCKLAVKLDKLIESERVSDGVAVCALLSLFTTVVKALKRDDAAACLNGLHESATQIVAVHFPEWQINAAVVSKPH